MPLEGALRKKCPSMVGMPVCVQVRDGQQTPTHIQSPSAAVIWYPPYVCNDAPGPFEPPRFQHLEHHRLWMADSVHQTLSRQIYCKLCPAFAKRELDQYSWDRND